MTLLEHVKNIIYESLIRNEMNKTAVARELNISAKSIRNYLHEWVLTEDRWKQFKCFEINEYGETYRRPKFQKQKIQMRER